MQTTAGQGYDEIRDAVRALCAEFSVEYHRRIEEERGYPEAFVDALTNAGWMAALLEGWQTQPCAQQPVCHCRHGPAPARG
jgi:hypothetical protein